VAPVCSAMLRRAGRLLPSFAHLPGVGQGRLFGPALASPLSASRWSHPNRLLQQQLVPSALRCVAQSTTRRPSAGRKDRLRAGPEEFPTAGGVGGAGVRTLAVGLGACRHPTSRLDPQSVVLVAGTIGPLRSFPRTTPGGSSSDECPRTDAVTKKGPSRGSRPWRALRHDRKKGGGKDNGRGTFGGLRRAIPSTYTPTRFNRDLTGTRRPEGLSSGGSLQGGRQVARGGRRGASRNGLPRRACQGRCPGVRLSFEPADHRQRGHH